MITHQSTFTWMLNMFEYVCVGKVNNLCFKIFIKSSHRILRSSIMLAVTASSVISFQLHIVY